MIYVIENLENRHLKIGYSVRPQVRLALLQTGNSSELRLVKQFQGDSSLERKIHRALSKHNIRGEWFVQNDLVWKYLDALCNYEYERSDAGHAYLVLWRETDSPDCDTDHCHFCGERHQHSEGDGHRAPHCDSSKARPVTAKDGTVLDSECGYIIKSRKPKAGAA